jgi:hypothetical protein
MPCAKPRIFLEPDNAGDRKRPLADKTKPCASGAVEPCHHRVKFSKTGAMKGVWNRPVLMKRDKAIDPMIGVSEWEIS